MSFKPSFRSLPLMLSGCLLAVSFTIVNCQKAPNRNGVKPTVAGDKTGAQKPGADAAVAQVGKDECAPEVKTLVREMDELRTKHKVITESSKNKPEAQKQELITKRKEFVEKCNSLMKLLDSVSDKATEKACLFDKNAKATTDKAKNDQNNVTLNEFVKPCQDANTKLVQEDGQTSILQLPEGATSKVKDAAKLREENLARFQKKNLVISDELKEIASKNSFQYYVINGKIVSNDSESAFEAASKKQVICSFGANTASIAKTDSMIVKAGTADKPTMKKKEGGETYDNFDLRFVDRFEGDAVMIPMTRVMDESVKDMSKNASEHLIILSIVCLNLNKDKYVEKDIRDVFKGHLKDMSDADLNKLREENKKKHEKAPAAAAAQKPAEQTKPATVVVSDADKAKWNGELETARKDEVAKSKKVTDLNKELETAKAAVSSQEEVVKDQLQAVQADQELVKAATKALEIAGGKDQAKIDAQKAAEKKLADAQTKLEADQAQLKVVKLAAAEKAVEVAAAEKAAGEAKVKISQLEIKIAGTESEDAKKKKQAAEKAVTDADTKLKEETAKRDALKAPATRPAQQAATNTAPANQPAIAPVVAVPPAGAASGNAAARPAAAASAATTGQANDSAALTAARKKLSEAVKVQDAAVELYNKAKAAAEAALAAYRENISGTKTARETDLKLRAEDKALREEEAVARAQFNAASTPELKAEAKTRLDELHKQILDKKAQITTAVDLINANAKKITGLVIAVKETAFVQADEDVKSETAMLARFDLEVEIAKLEGKTASAELLKDQSDSKEYIKIATKSRAEALEVLNKTKAMHGIATKKAATAQPVVAAASEAAK